VGLFNTPPHDQHYWAWFVDGGWPDSGNLIAGGPMDLGEALIPSSKSWLGLTQPHKTGL